MINLIKNELIKMVHKPGLYILLFLIFLMTLISAYSEKVYNDFYNSGVIDAEYNYEFLEEEMKKYDLNTQEGLYWYVSDKNDVDFYKLSKDYSYYSPEYYFIDNEIRPKIECMNNNQYIDKNMVLYEECKTSYDLMIKKLNNFDWTSDINTLINEKNNELNELNTMYSLGELSEKEFKLEKANISFDLDLLKYRLKYDIPFSYKNESAFLNEYSNNYYMYTSMNHDEKSYKTKEKLDEFKEIKASYFVNKYIVENNKIFDTTDTDSVASSLHYSFSFYGATFLVIALVIIFGGLISEEINKGTIKQLLIKPYSRSKILTSKIISGIIMFLLFTVVYAFINIVIYGLFTGGIGSLFENSIIYNFSTNSVIEINAFLEILLNFVCIIPMFIIVILFVLLVSVITSSNVGSIVSGFVLYFGSVLILEMDYLSDKVVANAFLPIVNWDFSYYLFGGSHWFLHCNLTLSIIVTLVTIAILGVGTYLIFKYKDIKNQ